MKTIQTMILSWAACLYVYIHIKERLGILDLKLTGGYKHVYNLTKNIALSAKIPPTLLQPFKDHRSFYYCR